MPYTYDGAGQPDYDGSEPETPNLCECCGEPVDDDAAVLVRDEMWCEGCARAEAAITEDYTATCPRCGDEYDARTGTMVDEPNGDLVAVCAVCADDT